MILQHICVGGFLVFGRRTVLDTCLGLLVAMSCFATATEDSDSLSGIMIPGMIFSNLIVPLNPMDQQNLQVLRASRAEIGTPPHLLRISNLNVSVREQGVRKFNLQTQSAIYDFHSKTIKTADQFHANGRGLCMEGMGLCGNPADQIFDAGSRLEIQVGQPAQQTPFSPRPKPTEFPTFRDTSPEQSKYAVPDPMSALELVQTFAGNLSTFMWCWRWVDQFDTGVEDTAAESMVLMAPGGGRIDLGQLDIQLTGPSLLLGPRAVMLSSKGVRFRQESSNGDTWIRMTGQGGVKTSIHNAQSGMVWIRSDSVVAISDKQLIQFEGGPLQVWRQGILLEAAENWQYVRVYANRRMMLSPGAWNMVGDMNNPEK